MVLVCLALHKEQKSSESAGDDGSSEEYKGLHYTVFQKKTKPPNFGSIFVKS